MKKPILCAMCYKEIKVRPNVSRWGSRWKYRKRKARGGVQMRDHDLCEECFSMLKGEKI